MKAFIIQAVSKKCLGYQEIYSIWLISKLEDLAFFEAFPDFNYFAFCLLKELITILIVEPIYIKRKIIGMNSSEWTT